MRSSSLATLMTKKLFKIATILDDLFFKQRSRTMTMLLSLNFADKNAQPQSRKKERVSHLKNYIFDTHTYI